MKSYIVGLLFIYCFAVWANGECPQGSTQLGTEPVCIYAFGKMASYLDALWTCNSLNGTTVLIKSAFDNTAIIALANQYFNDNPYIGVQKSSDGTWFYADRTNLTYQHWAPGEPRNTSGNYQCAVLDPGSGGWRAVDCVTPRPYFCSSPLPIPPTTPPPTTQPRPRCDSEWEYFQSYCYYLHDYNGYVYSFNSAESHCADMNAHLASIHSTDEDDFVYNLVPWMSHSSCETVYAWVGLYGSGKRGDGEWTDGTPVDYSIGSSTIWGDWGIPKQKDGSNYCSSLRYDYYSTWLSHNFGRFVCKKRSIY
ncbi:unnamed protein product, partial [Mesorhabditis belari]|uniref:C-type lectin domain-containing protein n=1 Tax=Mesorhabditis belari TaxID=2138241 RepID=A0AAF3J7A3_9BILA